MDKVLTIIIPTYNAASFLRKGLDSLHVEDEELFEKLDVLVIDDGSLDNSAEIAQEYIDRWPSVYRMIRKPNGGHGSGINVGAGEAYGKYFKVLDADDWVDKEGFAAYVRKLETIESDVVITPYQRYDVRDGKIDNQISRPEKYEYIYNLDEVMDQWMQVHYDMHFWGITYKTSFYQSLEYDVLEGVFYEDQEYATVPLSYASSVCFLEDMVYIYRVGDVNQSVFGDTQVKRHSHLEAVIERLLEQQKNTDKMSSGGVRYWRKKTTMVITSYYQIMLLKNKDKKMGRKMVRVTNEQINKYAPGIYELVRTKKRFFEIFSYFHFSNEMYELWAPKILTIVRKIKGQRV